MSSRLPDTPANSTSFLQGLMRAVVRPAGSPRGVPQAIALCRALLSERGEVSLAALARDTLGAYDALPQSALPHFFDTLVTEFGPDENALKDACDTYRSQPSPDNLMRLQRTVEPPRQELFRRINTASGGTERLIEMRRSILDQLGSHPDWKILDADLAHLFASWFNRGFLALERIDWNTPAIVLEKLIEYEAVHEIRGWEDLRRRLADDRRCFAFFHPALPHEPLIFIEVALTKGISSAIAPLLAPDAPPLDPNAADTAIFYSITNCQVGLRGISFGNLLIKQVAQRLGQEFPRIRTFSTLSPIPGLRAWLRRLAADPARASIAAELAPLNAPDWPASSADAERMRNLLIPLAAHYLINEKQDGEALDPVARFHLGNGARLYRLNWFADASPRGLRQSAGMMVNYLYRLDEVERNHELYVREQSVVASRELQRLADESILASM